MQEKVLVHILYQGFPLCGFSNQIPAMWPPGHIWVRAEASIPHPSQHRCEQCHQIAASRFPYQDD